ncbi:MAG: Xaa-Pro peptidase family protein [bacterium]|nr:Xaa-Pro peptidase family protein [bacterium]
MTKRINALQKQIVKEGGTAMLVTRLSNIRWLCGFSGSAGILLVTPKKAWFLSDFRYQTQAKEQVQGAEVIIYKKSAWAEFTSRKGMNAGAKLLVEGAYFTINQMHDAKKVWEKTEIIATSDVVDKLMAVKDEEEIALHKKAVAITDKVFNDILSLIKPGVRELDIALEISYRHRKYGADGDSFEPIVASGWRGALPHGRASEKKIKRGELVTVDFGCYYHGYASDLTRTVAVGKVNAKQREIYDIVWHANSAAIKAARPGMKTAELDAVARDLITAAGYGKEFGHGLGHGLGIDVHSWPRVSSLDPNTLQEGMIFTIEPGIYIDGFGGVRIEDDVLLTATGAKPLNKAPKELIIL